MRSFDVNVSLVDVVMDLWRGLSGRPGRRQASFAKHMGGRARICWNPKQWPGPGIKRKEKGMVFWSFSRYLIAWEKEFVQR